MANPTLKEAPKPSTVTPGPTTARFPDTFNPQPKSPGVNLKEAPKPSVAPAGPNSNRKR